MVNADVAQTNITGATGPISFTAAGDVVHTSLSIEQLGMVNNAAGWQQVTSQ